jgi:hypothetical protein
MTGMSAQLHSVLEDIDQQLDIPHQIWLLGAGVSFSGGIPLMYPLTERIEEMLLNGHPCFGESPYQKSATVFQSVRKRLKSHHHVEHVLSYLGDLIALAEQQADDTVVLDEATCSTDDLHAAHRHILLAIRHTVENGFIKGVDGQPDTVGEPGAPCITQKYHDAFVEALFAKRRAGLEHRPAVRFVTTNYDTLLEDALATAKVATVDGFAGGATGFWDPRNAEERLLHAQRVSRHTATIWKLHGSIDWIGATRGVVMRVRPAAVNPSDPNQTLLIYPQATKYQVTQRDPFASLFSEFRTALSRRTSTLLTICGYSFGDPHVNEEIELALRSGHSGLTILVLLRQQEDGGGNLSPNEGLPDPLAEWLESSEFGDRIRVLGSHGYYRGSLANRLQDGRTYDWWTFAGVTTLLSDGIEAQV